MDHVVLPPGSCQSYAFKPHQYRRAAFLDKNIVGALDSHLPMGFLVSLKVVRLLLAVSVAAWLAGGCLLGCGNAAMAAESDEQSSQAAVEGESCHTAQAHHCCAKAKPPRKNQAAKGQTRIDPKLTESFLAVASMPSGMMNDCPLAMGATAITSKASSNAPDSDQTANAELLFTSGTGKLPQKHVVAQLVPNRGPTYLRCCAFLI
jgi:hypothetical protein